jgi:hypothetical protein
VKKIRTPVRWDTEHEQEDVNRLLEAYADDFAIYLDRNGWEVVAHDKAGMRLAFYTLV